MSKIICTVCGAEGNAVMCKACGGYLCDHCKENHTDRKCDKIKSALKDYHS